jgi:hypothetical protein
MEGAVRELKKKHHSGSNKVLQRDQLIQRMTALEHLIVSPGNLWNFKFITVFTRAYQ